MAGRQRGSGGGGRVGVGVGLVLAAWASKLNLGVPGTAYMKLFPVECSDEEEHLSRASLNILLPLQPGDSTAANGGAAAATPALAEGTAAQADGGAAGPAFSLFAFPAYDNFCGQMYPAGWVQAVQARSTPSHQWRVVWDTAAYAPCHPVSLRQVPADFICISL